MVRLAATRRFTVDEYYRMTAAGILTEEDRVELIEGEIVQMSPIGSRHASCVARLDRLCNRLVGELALVFCQNPVRLNEHSEPEPDLMLLKPRADEYAGAHPGPADVLLIIEVADTSAGYDRTEKAPLYARFGIPEMWLVDLSRDLVEVLRNPSARGYRTVRVCRRGERIGSITLRQLDLAVDDILR